MKICLIAPLFDPWQIGGAERYAKTLAEELSIKHQIVVITSAGPVPRKQDQSHHNLKVIEIKSSNVTTLYNVIYNYGSVNSAKKALWHFFDLWDLSAYLKIRKILREEKPDLVHINGIKGFSPSLFSVIKHLRIPHVLTIHDYELISRWAGLYRKGRPISKFNLLDRSYMFYLRKMSSGVTAVVSPSKFTLNLHEKLGFLRNSHKYVIPNGIRLNKNTKPKDGFGREFLFLGQITENKGPHIAVKAFKRLTEKNIKLHIVGNGPYLETLRLMAREDKRIILHEFIPDKDMGEIFKTCSYAILPSLWYENFPLVINEVMNKGLPVIASNIGGIPEMVTNEYNGFLFEPGDEASLSRIIEMLINNKEILGRLSVNAIESSQKFSMENQMKSILDVYARILSH